MDLPDFLSFAIQTSSFILFLEETLGVEGRREQKDKIWTILDMIWPLSCSLRNGSTTRNLCDVIFLPARGEERKNKG